MKNNYNKQDYFKIFGQIIKKYRLKQNYTIPQISKKSNVPQFIWESIEKAEIIDEIFLDNLFFVAKGLNTTLYKLFLEVENIKLILAWIFLLIYNLKSKTD